VDWHGVAGHGEARCGGVRLVLARPGRRGSAFRLATALGVTVEVLANSTDARVEVKPATPKAGKPGKKRRNKT
jgi:hypothetical protein